MKKAGILILLVIVIGITGCKKTAGTAEEKSAPPANPEELQAKLAALPPPEEVQSEMTKDRIKLATEARTALKEEDFAKLELMTQELRDSKAAYANGQWRLSAVYEALNDPGRGATDGGWDAHVERLKRWIKARPESITPRVALGETMMNFAWKARGSGYADSITEKGAELMAKRLEEGRLVLLEGSKLNTVCPEWYPALMGIALGEGWSLADYDEMLAQAVKREPTFYAVYFRKAYYIQPRWYGESDEDWVKFAEASANKLGGEAGDKLYTRIAISIRQMHLFKNMFGQTTVSWPRIKKGFEAILKEHPDDLSILTEYCIEACMADDFEQARKLFTQDLKGRADKSLWDAVKYGQYAEHAFSK